MELVIPLLMRIDHQLTEGNNKMKTKTKPVYNHSGPDTIEQVTHYTMNAAGKMVEVETSGLELGQVVSYSDMANPRQHYVVTSEGPESKYNHGQTAISRETGNKTTLSITSIEGPGGWSLVDEIATAEEIKKLKKQHFQQQLARQRKEQEKREKRENDLKKGREFLKGKIPTNAKAVIVGREEVDECDFHTDYFATSCKKTVILAFSNHTRDLFPEMRKAAANAPETDHLTTPPTVNENGEEKTAANESWWYPADEHREKHSFGAGYYLKATNRYSSGWKVEKIALDAESLAQIIGENETAWKIPEKPPETIQRRFEGAAYNKPATVSINEEKNGVEIRFAEKPAAETLTVLKSNGWRWSRFNKCWYKQNNEENRIFAERFTV